MLYAIQKWINNRKIPILQWLQYVEGYYIPLNVS